MYAGVRRCVRRGDRVERVGVGDAPVFGLIVLWKAPRGEAWWREPREWLRVALFAAPFAALGSAALIGFGTCGCTEAELYSRDHIVDNVWLYFGRLLYPVGLEFPGHVGTAHMVAGPGRRGAGAARAGARAGAGAHRGGLSRRSPSLRTCRSSSGRPHATRISRRSRSRSSRRSSSPKWAATRRGSARRSPARRRARSRLAPSALNGWQTLAQNAGQADASDRWRQLVTAVDAAYPDVPPKSTVYVRGGPIVDELAQCSVMPAIGEVLWGDAKLFTLPKDQLTNYRARPGYHCVRRRFRRRAHRAAAGARRDGRRAAEQGHLPAAAHLAGRDAATSAASDVPPPAMTRAAASIDWLRRRLDVTQPQLLLLAAILLVARAAARRLGHLRRARRRASFTIRSSTCSTPARSRTGTATGCSMARRRRTIPIGYPATLGALFFVVRHTLIPDNFPNAVGFFQVFLGVATVGLAFYVGRRLFGVAVGLLAALWLALFPNLIFHTAVALSETLFNFLIMAALAVLVSRRAGERRARAADGSSSSGALLGASALVRPISLLLAAAARSSSG